MNKLNIGNIEIDLIKKNIKNVHLAVYPPEGRVRIAAPEKMSDETIRLFAISKFSWIKKQQSKFLNQDRQSKREFVSGESHYFQGSRYLLNIIDNNGKPRIELKGKYINFHIRKDSTRDQREKIMREWYRKELKKQIPELLEKWEKIIGVKANSWSIRLMKTKWGSCNVKAKRIWFNIELSKKNRRGLEYVIVHELVHLIQRRHNDVFRAYMDKFLPNWRNIRSELNDLIFDSKK